MLDSSTISYRRPVLASTSDMTGSAANAGGTTSMDGQTHANTDEAVAVDDEAVGDENLWEEWSQLYLDSDKESTGKQLEITFY